MQAFHDFIIWLNGYLWGPPILVLLFGTHLFLTFRLRFIQRYIGPVSSYHLKKIRAEKVTSVSSAL